VEAEPFQRPGAACGRPANAPPCRVVERPAREVHKDQCVSIRHSEPASREQGGELVQQPRRRGDAPPASRGLGFREPAVRARRQGPGFRSRSALLADGREGKWERWLDKLRRRRGPSGASAPGSVLLDVRGVARGRAPLLSLGPAAESALKCGNDVG
jgi:hypothetical protein